MAGGFAFTRPDTHTADFYLALYSTAPLPLPVKGLVVQLSDAQVGGGCTAVEERLRSGCEAVVRGVRRAQADAEGPAVTASSPLLLTRPYSRPSLLLPSCLVLRLRAALSLSPRLRRAIPRPCPPQGSQWLQALPGVLPPAEPPATPLPPDVGEGLDKATHSFHTLHLNAHLLPNAPRAGCEAARGATHGSARGSASGGAGSAGGRSESGGEGASRLPGE